MTAPFQQAVWDRFAVSDIVVYAVLWVGLWQLFDLSTAQVAMMVAVTAVSGFNGVLGDAYNLRAPVKHLTVAAVGIIGSGAMLAVGYDRQWLPLVFLAVSAWLLLDGIQAIRHAGATRPGPNSRRKYHEHVARCVQDELREGPLTYRELSDAFPEYIDTSELDDAIATLTERGDIEQAGSELRLAETEPSGPLAQRFERTHSVIRRLCRPITVEFDSPTTGYP